MLGNKTVTFTVQPYYDPLNQKYVNIITVNSRPQGPLQQYVRKIKLHKLSPFEMSDSMQKCCLALELFSNDQEHFLNRRDLNLMTSDDVPELLSFLLSNGYHMETQITNMLNQSKFSLSNNRNILFNVTYYPSEQPNITYMR